MSEKPGYDGVRKGKNMRSFKGGELRMKGGKCKGEVGKKRRTG